MPWSLSEGEIVQDPEGVSWTEVIKQQRHLRANEARVASMYAELDAVTEEYVEEVIEEAQTPVPAVLESSLSPFAAELVGLLLKDEREKSLTASLAQSMGAISDRMASEREERNALVAALSAIGQPVINVAPADVQVDVNVPTPEVTVEAPHITVEQPDVQVHVPPANVSFSPEIHLPSSKRTVDFTRDPLDGKLLSAEITEE